MKSVILKGVRRTAHGHFKLIVQSEGKLKGKVGSRLRKLIADSKNEVKRGIGEAHGGKARGTRRKAKGIGQSA
jgi:hypothetical protein